MSPYNLFLFDLDDTLLDFKESERIAFFSTFQKIGITCGLDPLYERYQTENRVLWKEFEAAKISKDHLKVERFRRIFSAYRLDLDPHLTSRIYLEVLSQTVVLIDQAQETCEWISQRGEIGIITNGIHSVQAQRIKKSKIAPYISFVAVSEEAGFAKPDIRFFEYSVGMAKKFTKNATLVIGDRLDIDVAGAHSFGVHACWYNPDPFVRPTHLHPEHEIQNLSQLRQLVSTA